MAADSSEVVTEKQTILAALRLELKEWEKSFAATHEGRKPGREDIKQCRSIGAKYKEYDRLRRPFLEPSHTENATPTRKRQRPATTHSPPIKESPAKRLKHAGTLRSAILDPYDPPIAVFVSPPTHRTSIGPTPQKDGRVLGILDGLSSTSNSKTPSKRKTPLSTLNTAHATPSKRPSTWDGATEPSLTGNRNHGSPLNSSKHNLLNNSLTPTARRIINSSTPTSHSEISKLRFDDTPSFLRRDSQRADPGKENEGLEEGISWSPIAVRKLPKAAGRGLSALVKGLRDMEDEQFDEEMDILREMEGSGVNTRQLTKPTILVNDSQMPNMPLGPDGGAESEDDVDYSQEGKGRDGRMLKVWKKKGQKRTTRMVLMRPNTAKWKPEPEWKGDKDKVDDNAIVEESQIVVQKQIDDEDEHEEDGLDCGRDIKEGDGGKNKTPPKKNETKKQGLATKIKKKISATAHANFRTLKIRSRHTKGKGGGRLGRRG